jgi:hypothetical protein
LIYFAIALVTDPVDMKTPIWNNKDQVNNVVKKIDIIYRQVKKNEVAPATDYLFAGTEKSNLDKTIARLEIMDAAMKGVSIS